MKRDKLVFVARRKTWTARRLQSLTLALAAVAGAAATEPAIGAIILHSGGGVSAAADTRASRLAMEDGKFVIGGESDGDNDSRSDLGTVTTVTVGAAASVSGASATSGSSVSATVTADTAADTLEIVAAGSTSLFAASNAPTSDSFFTSNANGNSFFAQGFDLTERSYEYTLSADTEVSVTQTQAGSNAKAFIQLLDSGTNDPLIDQRIDERGFLVSTGSLSRVLVPGQYAISGHSGGSYQKGHADATFALLLELTAASRWIDPAGGTFRVADNWEASIVPGATDVAVFDLPGTYTVVLDQDVTTKRLRANGAGVNVSFDLNGNDYVLDEIRIGGLDGDSVSVAFEDSSGVVVSAASAAADDDVAPAAHEGPAAHLRARLMEAGKGGTANVNMSISTMFGVIDNGGRVDVNGPDGDWDVMDLRVGDVAFEDATLNVRNGGRLRGTNQRAVLGNGVDSVVFATVADQGSRWETGELIVGNGGGAGLFIRDTAILSGRDIVVAQLEGSTGAINLSGSASLLQNPTDKLTIGFGGDGALNVASGARVAAGDLFMGAGSTGEGAATVGSGGRLEVAGSLSIGSGSNALLTVDGGHVERTLAGGFTQIHPKGQIAVRAGIFHEHHQLIVNGALAINPTDGAASVGTLPIGIPGQLSIRTGGTLKGNGIIIGKLAVLGGVNEFGGIVSPGNSPGTLTIEGDYEQTGGLLGIEVAGTAPGQFDVLKVFGDAAIAGDLELMFIDGFAPRQGDEFKFLDVGGALTGEFASIKVRNLAPGFQFDLRADAGGLTMIALNDGVSVPEPASWTVLFAGLLAILFRRGGAGPPQRPRHMCAATKQTHREPDSETERQQHSGEFTLPLACDA